MDKFILLGQLQSSSDSVVESAFGGFILGVFGVIFYYLFDKFYLQKESKRVEELEAKGEKYVAVRIGWLKKPLLYLFIIIGSLTVFVIILSVVYENQGT